MLWISGNLITFSFSIFFLALLPLVKILLHCGWWWKGCGQEIGVIWNFGRTCMSCRLLCKARYQTDILADNFLKFLPDHLDLCWIVVLCTGVTQSSNGRPTKRSSWQRFSWPRCWPYPLSMCLEQGNWSLCCSSLFTMYSRITMEFTISLLCVVQFYLSLKFGRLLLVCCWSLAYLRSHISGHYLRNPASCWNSCCVLWLLDLQFDKAKDPKLLKLEAAKRGDVVCISALTGEGMEEFYEAVESRLKVNW